MTQIFRFMAKAWDIDQAMEILKKNPREPKKVDVSKADLPVRTDPDHVPYANLRDPIIIGTIKDKGGEFWLPIDGWHRIRRAQQLGIRKLPAFVLTSKETSSIEIDRPPRRERRYEEA